MGEVQEWLSEITSLQASKLRKWTFLNDNTQKHDLEIMANDIEKMIISKMMLQSIVWIPKKWGSLPFFLFIKFTFLFSLLCWLLPYWKTAQCAKTLNLALIKHTSIDTENTSLNLALIDHTSIDTENTSLSLALIKHTSIDTENKSLDIALI